MCVRRMKTEQRADRSILRRYFSSHPWQELSDIARLITSPSSGRRRCLLESLRYESVKDARCRISQAAVFDRFLAVPQDRIFGDEPVCKAQVILGRFCWHLGCVAASTITVRALFGRA